MANDKIPKISDEDLNNLMKRMKPVVTKSGEQHYIKKVDPRTVAYTWDPKTTRKAEGLVELTDINTYHSYGYYGFFKPSISEVLAQIPDEYMADCVAFETLKDSAQIDGEYHGAITRLYTSGDAANNRLDDKMMLCVDAIVEYDGQIVLIERKKRPYGLALPGGKVEASEDLEIAVKRELKEETGLDAYKAEQFRTYADPKRDPRGRVISTVFVCEANGSPAARFIGAIGFFLGGVIVFLIGFF